MHHAGDFCRHIFSESYYPNLLQLVSTLNVGALSTHGTLYTLHICKFLAQTVIKSNIVHGKNYII